MKPASFEYRAPASLEEALEIMQEHGSDAKLLAGGQSLVPAMNFRIVQPALLVDLNRVGELAYIREEAQGSLQVGAMTRTRRLEFDPLIPRRSPLLAEAVPHIAHPQIRNRGTIGGSLVNADPAAELPVMAVALGARFKIRNLQSERQVAADDFYFGMFTTDLAPEEILVEVEIPPQPPRTGWSFLEVAPRSGDYALLGVAVLVTLDEAGLCRQARLVYLNAGDGPVKATAAAEQLVGGKLDEASITAAADMASTQEIDPLGNVHATPEFQRHLARVLTRRGLEQAAARARQAGVQ